MTIKHNNRHKSDKKAKYLYNPLEISLSGKQSMEKGVFSKILLKNLENKFKVGLVIEQNNQHSLSDTKINSLVTNNHFYSNTNNNKIDMITQKLLLISSDITVIDQIENSHIDKIVFINSSDEVNNIKSFENVFAYAGDHKIYNQLNTDLPYFSENNISELSELIKNIFDKKIKNISLYGLVLTGGKSLRMNNDKSLLEYYNKPQYEYVYDLLSKYCEKTFISSREDQIGNFKDSYEKITDTFLDIGPTGGILSAMSKYPDVTFLVVACDLPMINDETIKNLIDNRNPYKFATAYISSTDNFPEPLCAIYEPKSKSRMLQLLSIGYDCPRKFLINSEINLLEQNDKNWLSNVNTPEEYEKIKSLIS